MTSTSIREYAQGKLSLRADFAQASSPILYARDGDEFDSTPFQVADARHDRTEAFRLVREWLKGNNR